MALSIGFEELNPVNELQYFGFIILLGLSILHVFLMVNLSLIGLLNQMLLDDIKILQDRGASESRSSRKTFERKTLTRDLINGME